MDWCRAFIMMLMLLLFACCSAFTSATAKTTHHPAGVAQAEAAALNDAKALIEFKKGVTIDPFNALADWNEEAPTACNWTGGTCSAIYPGRVVNISLTNTQLVGSISQSISNLSLLEVLELFNNSFAGEIPGSIGKLEKLKQLGLCSNHLDGPIPPTIGNLSSLVVLDLCVNAFTGGIPKSFSRLTNLQELSVYMNLLSGKVPPFIGSLSRLQTLDLGNNKFEGNIPTELGNLSSLEILDLETNALNGFIPCFLAKLANLTELYIYENNLRGEIPLCLTNITSLTELDLAENYLQGILPSSLGRLKGLNTLSLWGNYFEGSIPESLLNISSLKNLALNFNRLQGSIPGWIGRFHKLEELLLFSNNFSGRLPDSLANATELQVLNLEYNALTGSIPLCFGKFNKLTFLNLAGNYFISGSSTSSQPIPLFTAFSNISELSELNIASNFIGGSLPSNIGNLWPKLTVLKLSRNLISGQVPMSIGNFSSLLSLKLDNNMLDGIIPYTLSNMQSIQSINLNGNKLHGKIPSEVSSMNITLAYLDLSNNRLSGSIPVSIGELVNLRGLFLQRNLLTGKIPAELGNCHLLEKLVLSENQLSGTIPSEVAGLRNVVFQFDLSRNRLSGHIPAEIQGLQMTQYINLSSNQLVGNIGPYMESWLDARDINLSFNHFTGGISNLVGKQMRQLQSIDLSHNSFNGSVPEAFFNLSYLHYLNFSYNFFSGEISCAEFVGREQRFNNFSLMWNSKLCGSCLGLPLCQSSAAHKSHSERIHRILKFVLIGSISTAVFLLLCMGIFFHCRKAKLPRGRAEPAWLNSLFLPSRFHKSFFKLSPDELLKATNNFSSANLIGEGSHGKVYRGVLSSGKVVAVKHFPCTDESIRNKNFQKECRVLGKIRHRNIVHIMAVQCSENFKAIVMPYLRNGNLHSLLHGRNDGLLFSLNLVTRLKILRQIASGLSYLHNDCYEKVIHCDIKPENILFDDDLTVKISDFGIARFIGNLNASTTTATSSGVPGTVGYIAPEYGTGDAVSEKGDVYSFGIVTMEVMTRLKPTHEMFWGDLTLPKFVSIAFKGSTLQQRRQKLQEILETADAGGGGIDLEDEEEMKAVESILLIGLKCTCEDAHIRPTMKEVESILSSIEVAADFVNHNTFPNCLDQVLELLESQLPAPGNTGTENREETSSGFFLGTGV